MNFKSFLAILAMIILFPISISMASSGKQSSNDDVEFFLLNLIDRAQYYSQSTTLSENEQQAHLYNMFTKSFDVPGIGRFILGRYWRNATLDQRIRFMDVFSLITVQTYAPMIAKISIDKVTIKGITTIKGTNAMLVHSVISRENDTDIKLTWRVIDRKHNQYQILDIKAEGVSLIVTLRSEYASFIRREGGLDGLIDMLETKVQQ